MTSLLQSDLKDDKNIQLGQASMNPPDFCLKWGDFNIEGSHAWKAKVLPTWNGTSLQAQVLLFHADLTQLY